MDAYKSAAVQDSAEAARPRRQHRHTAHVTGFANGTVKPSLTLGNVIHFIIAAFVLLPVFAIVAVFYSLGDLLAFCRFTIEATISSTYWLIRVAEESMAAIGKHRDDPALARIRGQRRALGVAVNKDWQNAGRALVGVGRAWSKVFGLGGLFSSLEERIQRANRDWRLYVHDGEWHASSQPAEFPEQYVVVDELPPGGSSARLYVVRKKDAEQGGPLFVLKYFDLRQGGSLESVVRESQAAELAKRLGLIIESNLGGTAFWYVMPYYHGETLTKGVLRNHTQAREQGKLLEHTRMSIGYVHQLLQVIAQYHEAGVIHKDIKPDNLIIAGERVYLIDIGLMTPLGSMAQLTTHGTEYFRDPEMVKLALQGREVREVDAAKFDVYSIGAVLFFAVSGEFPTSGALSRLPNDVPLAVQWVVNRAMTGMEQRYANARAMLTDVDYIFWAATTGNLEQVKPADLPSFKGMPVPPHLAATPENNTQWRERMAAAPGGYGAWYAAPMYQRKRKFSVGKLAGWLLVFSIVSATALGFAMMLLAPVRTPRAEHSRSSNMPQQQPSGAELPDDRRHLQPWFHAVDGALKRKIDFQRVQNDFTPVERSRVPERVAAHLKLGMTELASVYRQHWKKAGISAAQDPGILVIWRYADEYEGQRKADLERSLKTELAGLNLPDLRYANPFESGALLEILGHERFDASRFQGSGHHALASWFARKGEKPAMVVVLKSRGIGDGSQGSISKFEVESHYPGLMWETVFHIK